MDDGLWSPEASASGSAVRDVDLPGYYGFEVIGRGGDSVVYRARQLGLDRFVAVKVLLIDESAAVARFRRELEITVRLGQAHPHIMTVLDTGTTRTGSPCFVMEYHPLGSLHDILRERGPLPPDEVTHAGAVIADALSYAHGQGVLHRDVKPQNVLVLPTSYVLADFGLARAVDAAHSVSLERFSYRHASPQVLDGETPTVADDLWSLGSTLFTLLDGRPPFAYNEPDEDSALAYLRRVRTMPARTLDRPDVPTDLRAVVTACLARQRSDRPAEAATIRDALDRLRTEPAPRFVEPPPVSGPVLPISVSALAHLPAGDRPAPRPRPDPDTTGLRPVAEEPPPAEEAPAAPTRWRKVVLAAVIALLAGAALGVLGYVLRAPAPAGPGPLAGAATGAPVPSFTDAVPTPTGPVQVDVGDPRLAPTITSLVDRGTGVTLVWTDPTEGKAYLVVVRVADGSSPEALRTFPPGSTRADLDGLDPAVSQYCFAVVAILVEGGGRGASEPRCITR